MRREWSELPWFVERDARGQSWRFVLTSDDLCDQIAGATPAGDRLYGLTCRDERVVYLWAGQSKAELLDTVLHELMHVHLTHDETLGFRQEETAVSTITPRILPSLSRAGWKPPPLPDGWRSLAAHARAVRKE